MPIVLRGLVSAAGNGAFSGTLTGGNGRQPDLGQESYYQIDVPAGKKDLDANVSLTGGGAAPSQAHPSRGTSGSSSQRTTAP